LGKEREEEGYRPEAAQFSKGHGFKKSERNIKSDNARQKPNGRETFKEDYKVS